MKSYVRGLLIAPLAAPILYWTTALAFALADPGRRHSALQAPFSGLGYILAFGAPIAYAATLVAAMPAVWMVRRAGRRALIALLALGASVGLVTTVALGPYFKGDLLSIPLPPLEGAVLGATSAGVFWWLATARRTRGS